MSSRRRNSRPSSSACASLELRAAPLLAALLALQAGLLPVALLVSHRTHGALVAAAAVGLAAFAWPAWWRLCAPQKAGGSRRLWWSEEGEFQLEARDGARHRVELSRRSLVAGPWLVLVCEGRPARATVVIETVVIETPGCPGDALAALRRALARRAAAPAGPRHALRSLLQKGEPGS